MQDSISTGTKQQGRIAMQQQGEPSVEEILASIKKVIARDNREIAAEQRRQREHGGVSSRSAISLEDESEAEEILDLGTEAELVEELQRAARPADDETSPLINEAAQSSMRESLAALAMLSEPAARPQIVRSGETSLEGMVRDMLRPMLAEWLDRNLPATVEKLVAAEIARIAGKKG